MYFDGHVKWDVACFERPFLLVQTLQNSVLKYLLLQILLLPKPHTDAQGDTKREGRGERKKGRQSGGEASMNRAS